MIEVAGVCKDMRALAAPQKRINHSDRLGEADGWVYHTPLETPIDSRRLLALGLAFTVPAWACVARSVSAATSTVTWIRASHTSRDTIICSILFVL